MSWYHGVIIEDYNFTFDVKVILGFESADPDGLVAKIELNGSHD